MYTLDTNAAKAADVKSAFIQTAGKYIGKIDHVEYLENPTKGSQNIRIVFRSDAGQDAAFFINMVHHGDQRNDGGHKLLSAILACLRMRSTGNKGNGTVPKWNPDTRLHDMVAATVFPDMAGKRIGLLIQMEIEKNSESGRPRPIIYMPFEADSEKTASEILAQPPVANPAVLGKAMAYIADHPLIDRRPKGSYGAAQARAAADLAADNQFDDDIPF